MSGIGDKTIERIKEILLQEQNDTYVSEYSPKLHLEKNNIYQGDCLELMNGIPDKSIDMILCDLPYGTTACKWDTTIPFDRLWCQYERVIKDNGAIVLTGSEPFSSNLRMSNPRLYKYDWVWVKDNSTGFQLANVMPLKKHEDIMVFSKGATYPRSDNKMRYYPQGLKVLNKINTRGRKGDYLTESGCKDNNYIQSYTNYPVSIIEFDKVKSTLHPTQKPVALFEYLIKTYTNEGDVVLDNCIGSGTTAIAAINTDRNYIGIELDEDYYNIAKQRISDFKNGLE